MNPYLLIPLGYVITIIENLLHELGHKIKYEKYGIESSIQINWKKGGKFSCQISRRYHAKFDGLAFNAKKEILLIGIKIHLVLLLIYTLLIIFLPVHIWKSFFIIMLIHGIILTLYNILPETSDFRRILQLKKMEI